MQLKLMRVKRQVVSAAAIFLVLALVSASALAQQAPAKPAEPSAEAEIERLLDEIVGEGSTAVAMGKAKALGRFGPYVPNAFFIDRLEEAAGQVASPLVAFELRRAAQLARLDNADFSHGTDGMDGPMAEQGCVTDFEIVGPFDNPSMEAFHSRLAPERGEAGPYPGKMAEVDWRENPDFQRLCRVRLGHTIEPSTAAVVYLAAEVTAERAGEARLLLGADGAFKVWLNGEPVALRDEDLGLGTDGEAWPIELKQGANQLLIKLGSTGDGSLGLSARLVDPGLRPIEDLSHRARWIAQSTEPFSADDAPSPTRQGLAKQAAIDSEGEDGSAVWAAWLWSRIEPLDAATPWRDTGEHVLERARVDADGFEARELAMAAELFEEHFEQLDALELAHRADPTDAWVAARLASEYGTSLSKSVRVKERELLEDVVERHPDFLVGHIALSNWYANSGFSEKALALLESYEGDDLMDIPAYVRRLAYLHEEAGSTKKADELYARLESIAALNTSPAFRRCEQLIGQGALEEALELARHQQELVPWSTRWGLREAEILRAMEDESGAIARIDELIAAHPGSVFLYRQKADLLTALDRVDEALAVIEEAIAHRPQDRQLQEFHAFLQPETNRFYEPWMVEDLRQLAEQHPPGPFTYDRLVDQTLIHVAPNGLSTEVVQRAERVITHEGRDAARSHRVSFQTGDEQVEVLSVRVHKPDGTTSQDFDQWRSGGTRKRSRTYNDRAYINLRANNVEVGDVVEYRYRVSEIANENFRADYFGDVTYVQSTRPIALARYVVHFPTDWTLHFRAPTVDHKKLEDELPGGAELEEGFRTMAFEMTQVPHVKTDPGQPGNTDVYDYVMVSNKKTYDEIGRWWWNLIKEQLIVDEAIESKVAELTDELESDTDKLAAIHNYVVKNTRYLHVGLGIHGWKPYRTTTCFRNRFGDCKDKAALLKVMLDEAGIPAKMVLVRTRRLGTVDHSPAAIHIFNHAIAYVPSMNLYLDPTARFNGTTELTPMDQGAQGLIVDDGGAAKMVMLPIDKPEDNRLRQTMQVDLSGEEARTTASLIARGQNAVFYRQRLEDPERRDEVFEKQVAGAFSGAQLESADYRHLSELERPVEIDFEFRGGRLARDNDGKRFIYPMGAPKNLLGAYAKQASRTQDLSIRLPFENHTTIRYRLSAAEDFEHIPRDTRLDTKFCSLQMSFTPEGDELEVDIRYSIAVQRVSVEDYPEFRQFVSDMTAALNETVRIGGER